MQGDAAGRMAYMRDTAELLWPSAGRGAPAMVVLPSARTPRLLAPVRPRRAAAAALVRYTAQQRARERAAALAIAAGIGAGLRRARPAVSASGSSPQRAAHEESIDDLLTRLLGEPVRTSLALSPARPNRKPVLQVFDRRGRTLAFVKVGVSPLAHRLVDGEAHSLRTLTAAGLGQLSTPTVLHHQAWRGTAVLVTTALPLGRRPPRRAPGFADPLTAAMCEISEMGAPDDCAGYLTGLRARAAALHSGAAKWSDLLEEIVVARDAAALTTGCWHGDWTAWNCARHGRKVAVWDWERFSNPAPRGLDLLHFVVNDAVGRAGGGFDRAITSVIDDAPELLRPWRTNSFDARTVATLYAFDLALRYLADGTAGDVEQWALASIRYALQTDRRGATPW